MHPHKYVSTDVCLNTPVSPTLFVAHTISRRHFVIDFLQCKGIIEHLLRLPTEFGENEIITTIVQLKGNENVKNSRN